MGGRSVARSFPGAKTTNLIVPSSAIIILDTPAEAEDEFTLTSDPGRDEMKKTGAATKVDDTHQKLSFNLKDKPSKKLEYKLVHKRGKKSKHVIFRQVPPQMLSLDGEKAPQIREKQYFRLNTDPPRTNDADLRADPVRYASVAVKEPDTSG